MVYLSYMAPANKQRLIFGSRAFRIVDRFLITEMHQWGIPVLRVALGIVFLWFGGLKVLGVTPVADLIAQTYLFFPTMPFIIALGWWEILIGIGLLSHHFLRIALMLLWLQMAGTFAAVAFAPAIFFVQGNPFLLTMEGEFIVKNIVLISAGLVIGGYEITRKK